MSRQLLGHPLDYWARAGLSTAVPYAGYGVMAVIMKNDKSTTDWFNKLKKPKCGPQTVDHYMIGDGLSLLPVGYAAFDAFHKGGGFDNNDVKFMFAALAGTYFGGFGLGALAMKKKSVKLLAGTCWATTVGCIAATYFAFKVEKTAGILLCVPTVWGLYNSIACHNILCENAEETDDGTGSS